MKGMILSSIAKGAELMWKGMLAIFIVIVIVMAFVYLLNFFDKRIAKKKLEKINSNNLPDPKDTNPGGGNESDGNSKTGR